MASRAYPRLLLNLYVLPQLVKRAFLGRRKPDQPKRILVIHHLLLGDTLMTASLLAKLRERYPQAYIATAVPEAFASLFEGNPFGVVAFAYNPYKLAHLKNLLRQPRFDLALVPGDNRYGWTAFAMGARWICGFDGDRPPRKSACFDELRPYSAQPNAWTDMVTGLIDGPEPTAYQAGAWSAPDSDLKTDGSELPKGPYTLIHVGAKSPLKAWPKDRWLALIDALSNEGHKIVVSCGPGENQLLEELNLPDSTPQFPGNLPLARFWQLLADARLLVCLDNGVGHLARVIGTPTVCLFGPASELLFGAGRYWGGCPYRAISAEVPCRNQPNLFKRKIEWARTCERSPEQCPNHICMTAISVATVLDGIQQLEHPE